MVEQWKSIPSLPGYEASDFGRVRSVTRLQMKRYRETPYQITLHGRLLRSQKHSNGYFSVRLHNRTFMIGRLVCEAFHGAAHAPDCHADHINGDRADNKAANLRWLSPDANRALRRCAAGEANGSAKLTSEQVKEIRASVAVPYRLLAGRYGVCIHTISNVKRMKHYQPEDQP